jgi:hypothetical protein
MSVSSACFLSSMVQSCFPSSSLIPALHIHIWIQQQYEATIGDNNHIKSIVFRKRNEEVQTALRKWRAGWDATLEHYPSSKPPLYQKSALPFWFLAKYFNEAKDTRPTHSLHCGSSRQILPVGRLLRAIFMLMDNGQLNDNSPTTEIIKPVEQNDSSTKTKASLDAMNINFIMYEKK